MCVCVCVCVCACVCVRERERESLGVGDEAEGLGVQPLIKERTQGFAADPVYGRAKCLPVLGEIKT